jgi:hypothetical protein
MQSILEELVLITNNNNANSSTDQQQQQEQPHRLTIQYGERVSRIAYEEQSCHVTTETGTTYHSSHCIVTVPIGVLKQSQHNNLFQPPLPVWKQEAIDRSGVAIFNTLVVEWNTTLPVCSHHHPMSAVYMIAAPLPTTNPLKHGFVCPAVLRRSPTTTTTASSSSSKVTQFYIAGDGSTTNDSNGNDERYSFTNITYWKEQALEVVSFYSKHSSSSFDDNNNSNSSSSQTIPIHDDWSLDQITFAHITDWHLDPDVLGSYSAPIQGTKNNEDRRLLQKSIGQSLFFAGEHTNTDGRYQTMDGAYDSGIRAANAILRLLT